MSDAWAKGASKEGVTTAPATKKADTKASKMRYVPPPTSTNTPSKKAAGKGKMKYYPPPTDGAAWERPKKSASSDAGQWDELAAQEDEQLRKAKEKERAEAAQRRSVAISGNDKASLAAQRTEFDLWTKKDTSDVLAWCRAEACRVPNKRMARGGRLHKLTNIVVNNCDFINNRFDRDKRFMDASQDIRMPSGVELKRQFVAPLAKRVLNKIEEQEIDKQLQVDDPDSDDSDGMAM